MKGAKGGNRINYLLLIYIDENALSQTEREHCCGESAQLAQELDSKGQYLAIAPLHPVATATKVRVRDDKSLVPGGPFAETREQLGEFFLANAQAVDEAIAIASSTAQGQRLALSKLPCDGSRRFPRELASACFSSPNMGNRPIQLSQDLYPTTLKPKERLRCDL